MEPSAWSTPLGIWIGAIGTLCLFSLLYRENRAFRVFEHLFVGLAAGYLIKNTWSETLKPQWWDPCEPSRDGRGVPPLGARGTARATRGGAAVGRRPRLPRRIPCVPSTPQSDRKSVV